MPFMKRHLRISTIIFLFLITWAQAEHMIVAGGPSLRRWEDLRVPDDRHDRWWANFIRASTLRMEELIRIHGPEVKIVWIVHRKSYVARGLEDSKPYITWITGQATKRNVELIWINTTGELIQAINSRPRGSIKTFDFFGHSNRHAFMLDYGSEIMAVSTSWLHERDLPRIRASVFSRNAHCKSWGCHTGESMSQVWRKTLGMPLEGARGKTLYTVVGQGQLPIVVGSWTR
jgi:hypothetical protein